MTLHLRGLFTPPTLSPTQKTHAPVHGAVNVFKGWKRVPSVVCVVLTVPRSAVLLLAGDTAEEEGDLFPLHCRIHVSTHDHYFAGTLHVAPGRINAQFGELAIDEDGAPLDEGPLVASFFAPAWMLTQPGVNIVLGLLSTGLVLKRYLETLGDELEVFSAPVTNTRHVHIVPERPALPDEMKALRAQLPI